MPAFLYEDRVCQQPKFFFSLLIDEPACSKVEQKIMIYLDQVLVKGWETSNKGWKWKGI